MSAGGEKPGFLDKLSGMLTGGEGFSLSKLFGLDNVLSKLKDIPFLGDVLKSLFGDQLMNVADKSGETLSAIEESIEHRHDLLHNVTDRSHTWTPVKLTAFSHKVADMPDHQITVWKQTAKEILKSAKTSPNVLLRDLSTFQTEGHMEFLGTNSSPYIQASATEDVGGFMLAFHALSGHKLKWVSGYRTPNQQKKISAKHMKAKSGFHQTAMALDIDTQQMKDFGEDRFIYLASKFHLHQLHGDPLHFEHENVNTLGSDRRDIVAQYEQEAQKLSS